MKTSTYAAQVGLGTNDNHNAISDMNIVNSKIVVEESVVIDGKKLTVDKISFRSFGNIDTIHEIVIPNTIEVIASLSFWRCSQLQKIIFVPGSRLKYTCIRLNKFLFCFKNKKIHSSNRTQQRTKNYFKNIQTQIIIKHFILSKNIIFNKIKYRIKHTHRI